MGIERDVKGLLESSAKETSPAFLGILNNAIMETQPNGEDILYFSGKYVGSGIMKARPKVGEKGIPLLIKNVLERIGIGSITGVELKGDRFFLKIGSCPFRKSGPRGSCKFVQGMLMGMISHASDRTYRMKGVTCKKTKNSHCIFEFAR